MTTYTKPSWYPAARWVALTDEEQGYVIEEPESAKEELMEDGITLETEPTDTSDVENEDADDAVTGDDNGNATKTRTATGSDITLRAMKIADVLNKDAAFTAAMGTVLKAKEDNDFAPLILLPRLKQDFPDTDEENGLAFWPVPKTKAVETIKNADGTTTTRRSNNPDKYSVRGSDGKTINGSFYGDQFDRTLYGQAIAATLAQIAAAEKNGTDCDLIVKHPDGTVTTLDAMNALKADKATLAAEKTKWTSRRANGIAKLQRAVQIHHQMVAVAEYCPKVKVSFIRRPEIDAEGNKTGKNVLVRTPKPIKLFDEGDGNAFSITNFLSMSPKDAAKKGGRLSDLVNSGGRQGGEGQGDTGTAPKAIKNVGQFEESLSMLGHYLDNADKSAWDKRRTELLKELATKQDLLETFGDVCMALDGLWTMVQPAYELLKARKLQAEAAKDQTKKKDAA